MIEFKTDDNGAHYWVAVSPRTGEEFLRSPSFRKKKHAVRNLGRVRGAFRDQEPILKKTKRWIAGAEDTSLGDAVRSHAGIYAIAAAMQILEDVEGTPEVDEALGKLADIANRSAEA